MAKKTKPVYEFELDDNDEYNEDSVDDIVEETMDEISEILATAYRDIEVKLRAAIESVATE